MFLFAATYVSNSENNMSNKNFINFFASVSFKNSELLREKPVVGSLCPLKIQCTVTEPGPPQWQADD